MESKRNETFGSDLFGTNAIQETWSGRQEAAEADTGVPGGPLGGGRGLLSRGGLGCFLTCTPSSPGHVRSKNHAPEGFIPFGLRKIIQDNEKLK